MLAEMAAIKDAAERRAVKDKKKRRELKKKSKIRAAQLAQSEGACGWGEGGGMGYVGCAG